MRRFSPLQASLANCVGKLRYLGQRHATLANPFQG
jgi:hypothetical protein